MGWWVVGRGTHLILAIIVTTVIILSTLPLTEAFSKPPVLVDPVKALPFNKPVSPMKSPMPANPEAVEPGGTLRIELEGARITHAYIWNVYYNPSRGKLEINNYTLVMESHETLSGKEVYTARVPRDAALGLYDLVVYLEDGGKVVVPRSVWIVDPNTSEIRIAHMSDMHFGTGDLNYKITAYLLAQLLGAYLIISTGDYAEGASGTQYVQGRTYRYIFAYGAAEIVAPGNHDYPNTDFNAYIGSSCWYTEPLTWLLIFACNTRDAGYLTSEYLDLLEEVLASTNASVKIVAFHHPVFYWQGEVKLPPDSPLFRDPHEDTSSPLSYYWGDSKIIDSITRRFLSLVVEYNVTAVLSGHIHRDQYVLYKPEGMGIHYFITSTTTGHSGAKPNYNGLHIMDISESGEISFPYAPSWFIGFENSSRSRVFNAIPVDPNPQRAPDNYGFFFANLIRGPHAYTLNLINKLEYTLSRVIILPLPSYGASLYSSVGNGSVSVLDMLQAEGVTYYAINITLPPNTIAKLVIANVEDTEAPTAELKVVLPRNPKPGSSLRLYIGLNDDSTGIEKAEVSAILMPTGKELAITSLEVPSELPGDLVVRTGRIPEGTEYVEIQVKLVDPLGNTATYKFDVPLAGATTTTTPQATETTTTTTPSITTPTETSPSETTPTTEAPKGTASILIAVIVVGIIIVIAATLLRKR